ncbi:4-demethylwyosine synthase TYW1 [Candidatus Woesearchaeota archaeon]|nr:4-demethylwyosine synthase TYW1 [Candidatus Woesearchaeota archaeon]
MDSAYRKLLEKQGYRFIGEHSACKTCHYTASSIAGKGSCYKQKFYGIQSHRCVQMTVAANFCNMDCVFCWRKRNNSPFGKIDDPVELVDRAVEAQLKMLSGFGGNPSADRQKFIESKQPLHFAISLNGENTAYPRLGEFISELNRRGYTSFLVTNGQLPEVLAKIPPPTQLYISVSAPSEDLFNGVDKPMYRDGWQRLLRSLDLMRQFREQGKTRTVIRLTLVKGVTMLPQCAQQFAAMIKRGNPMFLECKSYMWVGTSREKLEKDSMASHEDIREFAKLVGASCGYNLIDEQEESRVVLMMQKDGPERFLKNEEISPIQIGELDAFSRAAATETVIHRISEPVAAAVQNIEQPLFQLKMPKQPVSAATE